MESELKFLSELAPAAEKKSKKFIKKCEKNKESCDVNTGKLYESELKSLKMKIEDYEKLNSQCNNCRSKIAGYNVLLMRLRRILYTHYEHDPLNREGS